MNTIAILSRKGGTGKTTLAINISVAAEQAGHTTALIDLDPQASAARWRDNREEETPAVVSAHASRLSETLHLAKEVRGNTRSHRYSTTHGNSSTGRRERCTVCPIIPCKPALIDLQAIGSTINIIKIADVDRHTL